MVRKPKNGTNMWLFPEALTFVLERQLEDGGWQSFPLSQGNLSSDIDGIVDTMASLLALLTRRDSKDGVPKGMDARITRADAALRRMLHSWDISVTDTVGFELILPAHLDMLAKYNLHYQFPARQHLMNIHQQRMANFKPEWLYDTQPTTLLYCLEAMIGKADFDRLSLPKTLGSIMCSPSSTAAYLMNATVWDEEAEAYLHKAMMSGGVPDPFPSNIFEITWVSRVYWTLNHIYLSTSGRQGDD